MSIGEYPSTWLTGAREAGNGGPAGHGGQTSNGMLAPGRGSSQPAADLSGRLTALARVIQIGAANPLVIASDHSINTLIPRYGIPLDRRGRVMRPAACSAFHGLSQGLTPCSREATICAVTRS